MVIPPPKRRRAAKRPPAPVPIWLTLLALPWTLTKVAVTVVGTVLGLMLYVVMILVVGIARAIFE